MIRKKCFINEIFLIRIYLLIFSTLSFLHSKQVAWLRVDTQTILTITTHVITKNHRIVVTHVGHRRWELHIKSTQESDRGFYMCQVNTDPMSSNTGYLNVVGKSNRISSYFQFQIIKSINLRSNGIKRQNQAKKISLKLLRNHSKT